jgi:hypothetical protein
LRFEIHGRQFGRSQRLIQRLLDDLDIERAKCASYERAFSRSQALTIKQNAQIVALQEEAGQMFDCLLENYDRLDQGGLIEDEPEPGETEKSTWVRQLHSRAKASRGEQSREGGEAGKQVVFPGPGSCQGGW